MKEKYILDLTKFEKSKRNEIIRYIGKLPEEEFFNLLAQQSALIRFNQKLKKKNLNIEFVYAMLLLAAHKVMSLEQSQRMKKGLSDKESLRLAEVRKARVKSQRRKKESKVLKLIEVKLFEEIKHLRDEDFSWREISTYIQKYHRKKISHGYLRTCFEKIKSEKEHRQKLVNQEPKLKKKG